MEAQNSKKLHEELGFVGLRAQATAVGLLQLSIELRRAGVLDDEAMDRIKDSIANELALSPPHHMTVIQHREAVRLRLDRLFVGEVSLSSPND